MFQKSTNVSSAQPTIIARGVTLEGNFQGQGDVVVEGQVKGSLTTTGSLTVGPEAVIEAEVRAAEASIAGTVQGNMTITNRCEVRSTAKLIGDVTAQVIAIEAGASFQGRLIVGTKATEAKRVPVGERSVARASV